MNELAGEPLMLFVAGSGRSGTSLFSGLVQRLGLHVPQPEVTAGRINPKGFAESRWVVDFHGKLLGSLAVDLADARPEAWQLAAQAADRRRAQQRLRTWLSDQLAVSKRLVIKDPRSTWFQPLWEGVATDLGIAMPVVTLLRHPAHVVRSKQLVNARSDATHRAMGWLNGMLGTEQRSRHLPRSLARYDALLADWRAELGRVDQQLGLGLLMAASADRLREADALVDPSLRRAESTWDDLDVPAAVKALCEDVWSVLSVLAEGSTTPCIAGDPRVRELTELDGLRDRYARLYHEAEAMAASSIVAARRLARRRQPPRARAEQ